MKFNKKLVVTSLSTVLGLGIVGSITGTIAWYQYSTRGTASLVGMSAGESGVLQLSADNGIHWVRDVASNDFFYTNRNQVPAHQKSAELSFEDGKNFYNGTQWDVRDVVVAKEYYFQAPVGWDGVYAFAWNGDDYANPNKPFPGQLTTFVENVEVNEEQHGIYKVVLPEGTFTKISFYDASNYREDNKLRPCTWGGFDKDHELSPQAYGNPVLGKQEMTDWKQATKAVDYFQFTVQLKAVNKSTSTDTLVAKNVWLTDIVLEDAAQTEIITDALRMHLHVDDGTNTDDFLISKTKVNGLDCYGELDLDGDGASDKIGGYDWKRDRNDTAVYGHYKQDGVYQEDVYIDENGNSQYDVGEEIIHHAGDPKYVVDTTQQTTYGIDEVKSTYNQTTKAFVGGFPIGKTVAQAGEQEVQEYLTITVTVWLEGWAQLDPYASPSNVKAIWDPDTLGRTIHAGLSFDVGDNAFNNY